MTGTMVAGAHRSRTVFVPPNPRQATAYYAFAVFASSAILLVLEIVAGRLIAPYVGASLYTWTSIIGVILGGLSLGNWLGGRLADHGAGPFTAGVVLLLSGLAALAILWVLTLVAPLLQASRLGLLSISFLFVATLFFLPALGLGVITPLLTTLALALDARTGQVVGRMHALAALGSILGTFVTGYWLVQQFGSRVIVLGSGVVLMVLAVPLLARRGRFALLGATVGAVVLVAVARANNGLASPCDVESAYFCIRVVNDSQAAPWGEARTLVLDHLVHGINHRQEPRLLVAPYVHLIDELIGQSLDAGAGEAFFYAGGGAYTLPRALRADHPRATHVVAELDPAVTLTAEAALFLDPDGLEILHQDARVALWHQPASHFDSVISDVFHDLSVPYHLLTQEYFSLAHSRLKPGGLLVMNVVDAWPDAHLVASVLDTLRSVFTNADAWLEEAPAGDLRHTFVLAASDGPLPEGRITARRGLPRRWQPVGMRLAAVARSDRELLRDDYVPVERLLAPLLLTEMGR